jgi:hypothetical protein
MNPKTEVQFAYASGAYQGFIKGLHYRAFSMPGMDCTDHVKFEQFIAAELERLDKDIQHFSQLTNYT